MAGIIKHLIWAGTVMATASILAPKDKQTQVDSPTPPSQYCVMEQIPSGKRYRGCSKTKASSDSLLENLQKANKDGIFFIIEE